MRYITLARQDYYAIYSIFNCTDANLCVQKHIESYPRFSHAEGFAQPKRSRPAPTCPNSGQPQSEWFPLEAVTWGVVGLSRLAPGNA
jgi:hypothetical protein